MQMIELGIFIRWKGKAEAKLPKAKKSTLTKSEVEIILGVFYSQCSLCLRKKQFFSDENSE